MKTVFKIFFILSLILLMTGCSLRFYYNKINWLVSWYKNEYLQLNEVQEKQFKNALNKLLKWHRFEALPQYAIFLETIEEDFAKPLDQEQLISHQKTIGKFANEFFVRASNNFAPILATLSKDQINYLFDALNESNDKYLEKQVSAPEDDIRLERLEGIKNWLERALGEITKKQEEETKTLVFSQTLFGQFRFGNRLKWQKSLRQILESKANTKEKIKLIQKLIRERSLNHSDEFKLASISNTQKTYLWLIELQKNLSKEQKIFLNKHINNYIKIIKSLFTQTETS